MMITIDDDNGDDDDDGDEEMTMMMMMMTRLSLYHIIIVVVLIFFIYTLTRHSRPPGTPSRSFISFHVPSLPSTSLPFQLPSFA